MSATDRLLKAHTDKMASLIISIHEFLPPHLVTSEALPPQSRLDDAIPNLQLLAAKTIRAAIRIIDNTKGYAMRRHVCVQGIDQIIKLLFKGQFDRMFQRLPPKGSAGTLRPMKMTSSAFWRAAALDASSQLKRAEGYA